MTDPIGTKSPYSLKTPFVEVPVLIATPENFAGYGALVQTLEPLAVMQAQWQDADPRSWRSPDEKTGVNNQVIEGLFRMTVNAQNHTIEGYNEAVASKQNENAGYTVGFMLDANAPDDIYFDQFNNHKDGQQHFIISEYGCILFLAKTPPGVHPDNVMFTDWVGFYVPSGYTAVVDTAVYHQPPLLLPQLTKALVMGTRQGSVHSCVSSFFMQEVGALAKMTLRKPIGPPLSREEAIRSRLWNYSAFCLRTGIQYGDPVPQNERQVRHDLTEMLRERAQLDVPQLFDMAVDYTEELTANDIQGLAEKLEPKNAEGQMLKKLIRDRLSLLKASGRYALNRKNNPVLLWDDGLPLVSCLGLAYERYARHQQREEMAAMQRYSRLIATKLQPRYSPYQQHQAWLHESGNRCVTRRRTNANPSRRVAAGFFVQKRRYCTGAYSPCHFRQNNHVMKRPPQAHYTREVGKSGFRMLRCLI